jgi:hypothetical protein
VSAVTVNVITFQNFDKIQEAFFGVNDIIAAITEALFAEREK